MAYSGKCGKVYVANVTQQNHQLNFRLPESRKPLSFTILMGRQALIGDFTAPEIDVMLEQMGPYGLVELGQESKREKVTYIFSVGSSVPGAAIQRIYDRNRGILQDEGAERRKNAAVAANAQMNTDETPMKNVDISIEEVDSGSLGSDSEQIGEGFKIDNEAAKSNENKAPRRRNVAR